MIKPCGISRRKGILVVVGALVRRNNELLLVKRKKKPWKDYWAIPGGKIKFGESLEEAVKREVREETGIDIKVIRLLGVQTVIIKKNGKIVDHFLLIDFEAYPLENELKPNTEEIDEVRWVKFSELEKYRLSSPTLKILKKFGIIFRKNDEHE